MALISRRHQKVASSSSRERERSGTWARCRPKSEHGSLAPALSLPVSGHMCSLNVVSAIVQVCVGISSGSPARLKLEQRSTNCPVCPSLLPAILLYYHTFPCLFLVAFSLQSLVSSSIVIASESNKQTLETAMDSTRARKSQSKQSKAA